jgi:Rieske Fe-S protein
MSGTPSVSKGISKDLARSGLTRLQVSIGVLMLLSAASGSYLLATDGSLWHLALSHAAGLVVIVVVDVVLGVLSLASSRRAYIPSLAAALLAVVLQLGDILTAPQYNMTVTYFASYLFGLVAFDVLLVLQVAVVVLGLFGRPYASYLARRKSRRGKELDYSRRGFLKALTAFGSMIGVAAVLSSVKIPVPSVLQSTTTLTGPTGSIAKLSSMSPGTPVYFEYPAGYPNMLMLASDGTPYAVSLLCTHVCCELYLPPGTKELYCQCHGSLFDLTGKVVRGPANVDLPGVTLRTDSSGYVYPTGVTSPGPCQV